MALAQCLQLLLMLLDRLDESLLHLEGVGRDGGKLLRPQVILHNRTEG